MAWGYLMGAIEALVGGVSSVLGGWSESEAEREQLRHEMDQLDLQHRQAMEGLSLERGQLSEAASREIGSLGSQLAMAERRRNSDALFSSLAAPVSNQGAYDEASSMLRQLSEAASSQRAALAKTGLRNTGTVSEIREESERDLERAMGSAWRETRIEIAGNAYSAASSWASASANAARYRQGIADAKAEYQSRLDSLLMEERHTNELFDFQMGYLKGEYDDAQYTWWEGILDFFGGAMGGLGHIADTADSERQHKDQMEAMKDSYSAEI